MQQVVGEIDDMDKSCDATTCDAVVFCCQVLRLFVLLPFLNCVCFCLGCVICGVSLCLLSFEPCVCVFVWSVCCVFCACCFVCVFPSFLFALFSELVCVHGCGDAWMSEKCRSVASTCRKCGHRTSATLAATNMAPKRTHTTSANSTPKAQRLKNFADGTMKGEKCKSCWAEFSWLD